jgi:hypothetical protein
LISIAYSISIGFTKDLKTYVETETPLFSNKDVILLYYMGKDLLRGIG